MRTLPNSEHLLVSEVAAYFRVGERTIQTWIEHGHLIAFRTPGKAIRIERTSVEKCKFPYNIIEE